MATQKAAAAAVVDIITLVHGCVQKGPNDFLRRRILPVFIPPLGSERVCRNMRNFDYANLTY